MTCVVTCMGSCEGSSNQAAGKSALASVSRVLVWVPLKGDSELSL